ncbi:MULTISPECIES: tRNA (adenosine(37)-N6)-threonylcarbamoyltransferase complex dimerization subunit type 1 TsaB [unclassified Brevibacterium]|uniref:tRNA (adenosine(37)-N6)-threonylcarbamoyltransferase complex dimerization subunit type 1 TsaB n=1 Tax=unclassified Brevibacterium TaxID=2614124 RepID=UPI0010F945F1|nr:MULTISPECIES: tRNA (adenosine(37)-N6)-threonylcarbamoyltransferase complex dimerization subunit type 1 TsaB [unclassified Brevibacterium]MCM1011684.1 tRNA (adenosine(37)-N6)-threonylcarbamoyltransferase complex dimerization subunit type 1 TsaB [Brevibacterium sp. XM4083]
MIILGIDTSQAASVALVDTDSGEVLAAEQADDQRRHVEFIGPALERVLAHPAAPDLVVTGTGPGPFTGLRVGIAAGIAVGLARGIPVHGLHSQAAIAEEFRRLTTRPDADGTGTDDTDAVGTVADGSTGAGAEDVAASDIAGGEPGLVLIAGDARRKEVYASVYSPAADLVAGPLVAKPADLAAELAAHGVDDGAISERLGRGFALYSELLGSSTRPDIVDPRAEYLAFAVARDLAAGRELGEPVPEYLREPDAAATPVRQSTLK